MTWHICGKKQDGSQTLLHIVYREDAAEQRKKEAMDSKKWEAVTIRMVEA